MIGGIIGFIAWIGFLGFVCWYVWADSPHETLKKLYMRTMKRCCANCKHYNKENGYCTIIIPSVRVWHEVTGWFNTKEVKDIKKADYRVGRDNCHWEKKENNG